MPGPGYRWATALVVVGLLALSGVAVGAPSESEDADTVFNIGYDAETHYFFWGITPVDSETGCEIENGSVSVEIGDDGTTEVDGFTDCMVSGAEVSGPNGQVNHGMFMKLFNSLYEGQHRGCVVSTLAKAGFGKGDQKVKTSDVDPAFESAESGDVLEVDFETILLECEMGNRGDADKAAKAAEKADRKANKANGRPDSPGNSAKAPGHNKTGS